MFRGLSSFCIGWEYHILLKHLECLIVSVEVHLGVVGSPSPRLFGLRFTQLDHLHVISLLNNHRLVHLRDLFVEAMYHILLRGHLSLSLALGA